jgi:signal transduction histidine kinase
MDAIARRVHYGQPMHARALLARPRLAAVADAGLALTLFAVGQAEIWFSFGTGLGHGSDAVTALLATLMTLPLAFRRRWPLVVAALVTVPSPLVGAFTSLHLLFFGGFLPLLTVAYTLAASARSLRSLGRLALPLAALVAIELEVPEFRTGGEVVFDWLWFAATIAIGLVVRARSLHAERSESRAVRLETERDTVLREERARIARELHDVIAHSVSVIVVQAGAAEPLVEEDPEQARLALRSIRSTASDALGEMRRLLGILRAADDELSLTPQPSVAETTAPPPPPLRRRRGTGSSACASASACTTARSRSAAARAAASRCARCCRRDPRAARRRSGARAGRLPPDPRA